MSYQLLQRRGVDGSRTAWIAPRGFGSTARRDAWWVTPLAVFIGLSLFIVYATWAAFQDAHYTYGPYLSPFYSPELSVIRRMPGSVPSQHGFLRGFPFAGAAHPAVSRSVSRHLLLLPRRLLQGVLGRFTRVRRR